MHGAGVVTVGAEIAKKTLIIGGAVVDIKAADGVASAVKGAGVFLADAADWGPFAEVLLIGHGAIFVDLYLFVQHDISGEDGVGADLAIVDKLGKFPQLLGAADPVRITLRASSRQLSPLTTL